MEAIIRSTMPREVDEPSTPSLPHVVTQEQFCTAAGINRVICRKLRDIGYIPAVGVHPVYIPLRAGLEGLEAYVCDSARDELGKNAKYAKGGTSHGSRMP